MKTPGNTAGFGFVMSHISLPFCCPCTVLTCILHNHQNLGTVLAPLCFRPENLAEPGKSSENPAWSQSPSCSHDFPDSSSCTQDQIQILHLVLVRPPHPLPGLDSGSLPRDPELPPNWPQPFAVLRCAFPPWDLPPPGSDLSPGNGPHWLVLLQLSCGRRLI